MWPLQTHFICGAADHWAFLPLLCLPSGVRWQHMCFAGASTQACPLLPIWLAVQTSPDPFQFQGHAQLSWIKFLDVLSLFCLLGKTQKDDTYRTYWYLWTLPLVSLLHSLCPLAHCWPPWPAAKIISLESGLAEKCEYKMGKTWFSNTLGEVSFSSFSLRLVPSVSASAVAVYSHFP